MIKCWIQIHISYSFVFNFPFRDDTQLSIPSMDARALIAVGIVTSLPSTQSVSRKAKLAGINDCTHWGCKGIKMIYSKWCQEFPMTHLRPNKTNGFLSNQYLKSNTFGWKLFVISLSVSKNQKMSWYQPFSNYTSQKLQSIDVSLKGMKLMIWLA